MNLIIGFFIKLILFADNLFEKNMRIFKSFLFIVLIPFVTNAQQKMLTVEDAVLKQRSTLGPDKLNQLSWIPGTNVFAWIVKINGKEVILREDAKTLKIDTVLGIDKFKESLHSANPDAAYVEKFPAITWIDEQTFRVYNEHYYFHYHIQTNIINALARTNKDGEDMEFEPTLNRVAYTINNNVFVADKTGLITDVEKQLSDGAIIKKELVSTYGGMGIVNGKAVARNEFGINKGLFWSAKGNKLAYYQMNEALVSDYSMLNLDNKPASAKTIKYPMAGNKSQLVKVFVQDFSKSRQFEVQTGALNENYYTNVSWSPEEEYIFIAVVNREQNEMKFNEYDGTTGGFIRTLFTETNTKYVEPEKPAVFVPNHPSQFLWFSKRDGFNHLYLYDTRGKLIKQVTKGKFDVTELLGFDKSGNTAFYIAASENGLERKVYSVDLTTGKTITLTLNTGVHSAILSDDGSYFIDTYSNTTMPRRITLMDRTGGELSVLVNSQNPISNYQPCGLKLFSITSTDKKAQLNCRMFYPPQFDSTKKYPVLVYLYGGPHAQLITNSWLGGADMWLYYMAQQGFVVFTLDNRGSMNRGLEFENVTFRKLGTIEREDQIAGAEFLKQQRYVDSTRMGIFGWSFGGFMSIGMMTRTNEFKVGVAGGPVIDWSMYEIMYTERYMDKPQENKEGYDDANLMNYDKNLKGKLLIIHGTSDDVVVWQHSLNYIKKCVEDGVQVDYFVYPGHKHNVLGKDRVHLMQKVTDYFKQNL
ncbi:MAG: DPP IV N-terminal domain-containing protein [Bacteroidota bacterium]